MTQPLFDRMEVGAIRFTRRVARQCARRQPVIPDWVVCDTIANGSRSRVMRGAARAGSIFRFVRTYGGVSRNDRVTVRVLGRLTRGGCSALQLVLPAQIPERIWDKPGFLNRTGSK